MLSFFKKIVFIIQLYYSPQHVCCSSCKRLLYNSISFPILLLSFYVFGGGDQKSNMLGHQKDCAMSAFTKPLDLLGKNLIGVAK